ncbi:NUDIX domain-containing protein [Lentzea californiensis]|uniref:NUDIX domain-containing protein n=1 Tax=Lentzea californiensis TaxID=438851 RepID=UPI0021668D92|nr:NUDIX hydrolase [Lentzea californiensis]
MDHSSRALSGAGALFFDEAGRLLLVEPTYKPYWEIPGGVIEHGETPSEACRREIEEELGLVRELGRLLVADWAPRDGEDRVLFVFEGGLLTAGDHIQLQAEELRSYEFVTPSQAGKRLIPRLARRVAEALRARESGETRYLEHGVSRSPQA